MVSAVNFHMMKLNVGDKLGVTVVWHLIHIIRYCKGDISKIVISVGCNTLHILLCLRLHQTVTLQLHDCVESRVLHI